MFTKRLLVIALIISALFSYQIFANELEIDEGSIVTFSGKRAGLLNKASMNKDTFIGKLKKDHIPAELNLLSYDSDQARLIHLVNGSNVKSGQKFTINTQSHKGDLYFYAFRVKNNQVEKLFPVGNNYYSKNPINQYVAYTVPNNSNWLSFSSGTEEIYLFLSNERVPGLENISSSSSLGAMLNKYRSGFYSELVTDKVSINKSGINASVYSNMVGFKNIYAEKIKINVK